MIGCWLRGVWGRMRTMPAPRRPDLLLVLRGLAALAVMLRHLLWAPYPGPGWTWVIAPWGYIPVLVFFALSGYLITKGFCAGRYDADRRGSLGEYYRNRFFRIVPLYYAAILVCALVYLDRTLADPGRVLALFVLYENYRPVSIIFNNPFWTIPIEVFYYALAPALFVVMRWTDRRVGWPVLLAAILGFYAAYSWFLFRPYPSPAEWHRAAHVGFFYNLQAFLIGATANFVVLRLRGSALASHRQLRGLLKVVLVLGGAALLAWGHFGYDAWHAARRAHPFTLYGLVPSVALLVGLLAFLQDTRIASDAGPRATTARVLRAFEWLGLISYGVYLFNVPVAAVIDRFVPLAGNARALAVVAATLVLSTLAYHAIERPFMRLRTRPLEQQRELGSV